MAISVQEFCDRVSRVRVVRVEVRRKRSVVRNALATNVARPNLWPRVTFELDGRTKVVPMTHGMGTAMCFNASFTAIGSDLVAVEILRMAVGRSSGVSVPRGSNKWDALIRASADLRQKIADRLRAAQKTKRVMKGVERDLRSQKRREAAAKVREVLVQMYGVLSKRDLEQIWDDVHKEKVVGSVMEA